MKILLSDLKKLIPGLRATPKQIGDFLTMAGFMLDSFEKTKYLGKPDFLMSFEIRHNRGDCLSVISLAREVAAFFGLKLKLPEIKSFPQGTSSSIKVADGRFVKRVLAYEINGIKNATSPKWLTDYLALHDMRSKNLLVDLSNYVMLLTGYPSHLLDTSKILGKLYWDMNIKFNSITTLDGTLIKLNKNQEIILLDDKNILALDGIVGGKKAELNLKTTSIIAESAIYDSATVRQNALSLKVVTEASNRLSKYLDPNGLDYAMELLLTLIITHCGNENTAIKKFSFYPKKRLAPIIKFDPQKPSVYAGIEINKQKVVEILHNLGFETQKSDNLLLVKPPTGRMDIEIEEDVIEEVVRMYSFSKIPVDSIPALQVVKDITPRVVNLIEKLRDILSIQGLDEILTIPLTSIIANEKTNYRGWQTVSTQNSVNEDYPDLRQSTAYGLITQLKEYQKKHLLCQDLFEIGTVFGKNGKKYLESHALGILVSSSKNLETARNILEIALRYVGITDIAYFDAKVKPLIANPYTCFDILVKEKNIGIIYKLKPQSVKGNAYLVELDLNKIADILPGFSQIPVCELMQKIITLDANIILEKADSIDKFILKIKSKIGRAKLWNIEIADTFQIKDKIKYTIRVSYMKLNDQEAKKLHLKIFGLNK